MRTFCLIMILLTGCTATDRGTSGIDPGTEPGESAASRDEGDMRILAEGAIGALASGDVRMDGRQAPWMELAESEQQFRSLWRQYVGSEELPKIDFDRMSAVFLLLPVQRSGGYAIQPRSITRQGERIVIDATLVQPRKGEMTTQALTAPYAVVALAKGDSISQIEWSSEGRAVARRDVE